jgi:hypothetical protein
MNHKVLVKRTAMKYPIFELYKGRDCHLAISA